MSVTNQIDIVLNDTGDDEYFPTLEEIERAEPEFWRRIKARSFERTHSGRGITKAERADTNFRMLLRYKNFRKAAEYVSRELQSIQSVVRVALFGSLTQPLQKEVPRFSGYRSQGIKVWHECKDIDLAVWITEINDVSLLKRVRNMGMTQFQKEHSESVVVQDCDIFLFHAQDSRYLGRVCHWKECPKEKPECFVPSCGEVKFLRQHKDFTFDYDSLQDSRIILLYDRHE